MSKYLLAIWEDVEPELHGPIATDEERDAKAGSFRIDEGEEHGLYRLDIDANGIPSVSGFSGIEMDELVEAAANAPVEASA